MTDRRLFRLGDIKQSIENIDGLLSDADFESLYGDVVSRAAFERFLEILSEASRHIGDDLKRDEPDIPWRRIADIGNHLRHAYHRVDFEILWNVWADGDLAKLNDAVGRMIGRLEADD
ncbi:MAG: DUF86 domain-containing protein [Phyllobacteriaceae bacterium]|jgi:uncharacterized protein with HEPN domain|nr:DUF86 domain-containing protein [Phyllobacteriaceae bacterium]